MLNGITEPAYRQAGVEVSDYACQSLGGGHGTTEVSY